MKRSLFDMEHLTMKQELDALKLENKRMKDLLVCLRVILTPSAGDFGKPKLVEKITEVIGEG